jgi:hypothetical protein
MTTPHDKQKKLHFDLTNVGLRAQATAVGLVQLCIELQRSELLEAAAIERIKNAIADDVSLTAPRGVETHEYRSDIKNRLDKLFAGEQEVGSAEALAFGAPHDFEI